MIDMLFWGMLVFLLLLIGGGWFINRGLLRMLNGLRHELFLAKAEGMLNEADALEWEHKFIMLRKVIDENTNKKESRDIPRASPKIRTAP